MRRSKANHDDDNPDTLSSTSPIDTAMHRPPWLGLLVGAAVMLWLVVLGCACWLNVNDPGPIPRKVVHPLSAFDGVFRKVGPLLPFCVALPRAFVPLPASRGAPARTVGLYVYMTVLRIVLYLAGDTLAPKAVADHVLLGAAVYSMLCTEALAVLCPLLLHAKAAPTASRQIGPLEVFNQTVRVCRVALFVLALALAALVAADMFYTARFFHRVPETLYSVAAGLGFFQLPLAWYAFTRQEARPWPVKLGAE